MSIELLATIYAILIIAASVFGGIIPRFFTLTHARMQTAISFVAGVILGIGVLHLVPHGFQQFQMLDANRAIDRTVWWVLMGFLLMFFLQRLFHFHSHETPAEVEAGLQAGSTCSHEAHDHSHDDHSHDEHCHDEHCHDEHCHDEHCHHDHNHHHVHHDHSFTWAGVFFGLTLHSLVDGITLFAAIQAEEGHAHGWMVAGLGYFLAVFLHKPFDSLSIASLMIASGWSAGWRTAVNLIYSLVAPLGMLMFYFGLNQVGDWSTFLLAGTLCFAAGACVCISTSDLLPELQFHSHDRLKLSISLLLGLALAWGLVFIENQGHDHHVHPHGAHEHDASDPHSHGHSH